jgi:antitoxin component HigA of HigAB toxin-antitoxin module
VDIHPTKTKADSETALADIDGLFDAVPNTPAGDRLDVLTTRVETYEAQQYSIPAPDPIGAIMSHMESRGLSRRDLAPYLGSRARVADGDGVNGPDAHTKGSLRVRSPRGRRGPRRAWSGGRDASGTWETLTVPV